MVVVPPMNSLGDKQVDNHCHELENELEINKWIIHWKTMGSSTGDKPADSQLRKYCLYLLVEQENQRLNLKISSW